MKKIWAIVLLMFLFILIFTIQIIFLNKVKLFGVIPNLLLVTVVMVAFWYNTYLSGLFAFFTGIIADILFSFNIGKSAIIYLVIAIVISLISKIYRKDNNAVIIYVTIVGVLIFETSMLIVNLGGNINVLQFVSLIFKATVINIGLAYIVRKLLQSYTVRITKNLNLYIER